LIFIRVLKVNKTEAVFGKEDYIEGAYGGQSLKVSRMQDAGCSMQYAVNSIVPRPRCRAVPEANLLTRAIPKGAAPGSKETHQASYS
jgi:hypothetical protein